MSAVEIEDVLSSIRRLVSEDLRPAGRGSAGPEAAKPALILTPALRVVPEAEPARVDAVQIKVVVASVGAAVAAQDQDWEPEAGDAVAGAEPGWADATWDPQEASDEAEAATVPGDDVPGENMSGGDAFEFASRAEAPGWAQAGVEADLGEAVPQVAAETDMPPPDAEWLAQAEAEVIAGLEQRATASAFDLLQAEREMSFDEEVLRDLVRDLIREELQGHLGERITRNIRKLVRAEIARALTAAELD